MQVPTSNEQYSRTYNYICVILMPMYFITTMFCLSHGTMKFITFCNVPNVLPTLRDYIAINVPSFFGYF
jgi:hypothetical protein